MPKDYAKRVLTTSRKALKKQRPRYEFFILPIALLVFVIAYIGLTHKEEATSSKGTWFSRLKTIGHKNDSSQKAHLASNPKMNPLPTEPDIHFDFYNQLPNQHVPLPVEPNEQLAVKSALKSEFKPVNSDVKKLAARPQASRYLLSFGQFRQSLKASEFRISLMLSGCEADIVEFHSTQGKMYRVQRGPFASQAEAKKLQGQLLQQGVTCEVQKA